MHPQSESNAVFDAFAVLQLKRGPWIDPDTLKERYLRAAKDAHPDQQDTTDTSPETATAINEAHKILSNEAARLAHFILLETGRDITQDRQVPNSQVELFMQLSPLFQQCDRLIRDLKSADSNILKARHYMAANPILQSLTEIQDKINQTLQTSRAQLKALNESWLSSPTTEQASLISEIASHYGTLSYLQRWRDTIEEKSFELTPG